jgi:hypothetical protein
MYQYSLDKMLRAEHKKVASVVPSSLMQLSAEFGLRYGMRFSCAGIGRSAVLQGGNVFATLVVLCVSWARCR